MNIWNELPPRVKAPLGKFDERAPCLSVIQGLLGTGRNDEQIAEAYLICVRGIEHWYQQAVEEGPESLLGREVCGTRPIEPKLDGAGEA